VLVVIATAEPLAATIAAIATATSGVAVAAIIAGLAAVARPRT
jgi:hypothetical protein